MAAALSIDSSTTAISSPFEATATGRDVPATRRSPTRGTGDGCRDRSTPTQSVAIGRIETVALPACGFEELQRVELRTHETARRVPRRPEQVMADLVRQRAPERTRHQQLVPFRQEREW